MIDSKHIISKKSTILEALQHINNIKDEPLVLFCVNHISQMCGTLTDGDVRRALIKGVKTEDKIEIAMHKDFNFLRRGVNDGVADIKRQRDMKMKLIPVLDDSNHIVEIINLEKYASRLQIDAVLMAGGKGERLRPLTEKTPKPLLPVGGKAIINHNVENLISYGVKHINVTVNYLHEQIEEHFDKPVKGIKVETALEPHFLGTMGSIKFVKKFYNDTILLMNSDLFTNIDYEDFYLHFKEHKADMSVAAVPYKVSIPYGIFEVEDRNIQGLVEKPTYTYYANAGIYLFKRSLLDLIPEDTFFNATDFIELLIDHGLSVIRYPLNGTWIDIGNPQEYQKANDLVKHLRQSSYL